MILNLNYEGFENYLIERKEISEFFGGVQYKFRFSNNYGASVIKHRDSYGYEEDLWELAVIVFTGESNDCWDLTYDTSITCDVEGWLTDEEVRKLLAEIKAL